MRTKTNYIDKGTKNIFTIFSELTERLKLKKNSEKDETTYEERKKQEELQNIKDRLDSVRREISTIGAQFNDASEPECIAYYAYLLKATEAKYDYLLRLAREKTEKAE